MKSADTQQAAVREDLKEGGGGAGMSTDKRAKCKFYENNLDVCEH